jgi:AAA+ ATPase superfamily predicted ATPase
MAGFIGRAEQLVALRRILQQVNTDGDKPGRAVLMRGRRRVGKSRLVEEFLEQVGVPYVFFTASTRSTAEELQLFSDEVVASNLPGRDVFANVSVGNWDAALRLLITALPSDEPSVVVIDELPYLTVSDPAFEGTLQKIFDGHLSKHRVMLIGIGSDLAMMEALNKYDRPFHQRAIEMVIPALSPAEVGAMLHLDAVDAFDAYLVTGGLPLICKEWKPGMSLWGYLEQALNSPTSALIVSGERSLAAEFPPTAQPREVLSAIGSGERTFTNIARAAGDLQQATLLRSLKVLTAKRIVVAELPLSTKSSRETRYRITDPHLRFWLAFLDRNIAEIERGRGDRVLERIQKSWPSWRGRAIEPVVKESIDRLPAAQRPHVNGVVGSYWTRINDPEIDIVLADKGPIAKTILGVGSIKWLERAPFNNNDFNKLLMHRSQLPGATDSTPLLVVSRSGCEVPGVQELSPDDLLAAWK